MAGYPEELKRLYSRAKELKIANEVLNAEDEYGRSALLLSISIGNVNAAEYIIELGADVNASTDERNGEFRGNTPLIEASGRGYVSIVMLLLKRGAQVDAIRKDGIHAAVLASQNGHLHVLKLLTSKNPNVVNLQGDNVAIMLLLA